MHTLKNEPTDQRLVDDEEVGDEAPILTDEEESILDDVWDKIGDR